MGVTVTQRGAVAAHDGKAGGEMVYLHGAAAVYAADSGAEPAAETALTP